MQFQYILFLLGAFVIANYAVEGRTCYTGSCTESNAQPTCTEIQDVSTLQTEECVSPYPDRVPICAKSVHTKGTGDGGKRVVGVYRYCGYTRGKITYKCEAQHLGRDFMVNKCWCNGDRCNV